MRLRALRQALAIGLALWTVGAAEANDRSPSWNSLTPTQKQALAPLQRDWTNIEPARRQKWLEVAALYPQMQEAERERLQARMSEWARMAPAERATARQQFQEVRRVPDEERKAHWQAYQSLTAEEREHLAQRAKPAARAEAAEAQARAVPQADANGSTSKRNIVSAPAQTTPRVVNPGVQQARPGATTTPLTTRATPPLHNQAGLPKIAATPNFVDPQTLLPQKGPQGAAVRSAAPASEPKRP